MNHLKTLKAFFGIGLLVFAYSCAPAENPITTDSENVSITIYSPVENQQYPVGNPELNYLVLNTTTNAEVPNSQIGVSVHDIVDDLRVSTTPMTAPQSGAPLPTTGDGTHELEFVVNDEAGQPIVTVIFRYSTNTEVPAPVAVAGTSETVRPGETVTLSGSGSYSEAGLTLSYLWEILSAPEGSTALLSDPAVVSPTFVPDLPGNYVLKLVVTDSEGTVSAPALVTITTENSAPVADAGPDQVISLIGDTVQLDGSQSFDNDGDGLYFNWSFKEKPEESTTVVSDPSIPDPTFVVDAGGTYKVRLVVIDDFGAESQPSDVTYSFNNVAPVAEAATGEPSVPVGETVFLDGSGSFDSNGDPLTFQWAVVSQPEGSEVELAANGNEASFVPEQPGTYVVSLTVSDGTLTSEPSNATIVATVTQESTPIQVIWEALSLIDGFDGDVFRNWRHRRALTNKLLAVVEKLDNEDFSGAVNQLADDVIPKIDGCAFDNAPEWNDWIVSCEAQDELHPLLDGALVALDPDAVVADEDENQRHGRFYCLRQALEQSDNGRGFFQLFWECVRENRGNGRWGHGHPRGRHHNN